VRQAVDSRYDWRFFVLDAARSSTAVQLAFPSTRSLVAHPLGGRILVSHPTGWLDTGVELLEGACYDVSITLDNRPTRFGQSPEVRVFIDGTLAAVTMPLDPGARRVDSFRAYPVPGRDDGDLQTTLWLDNFGLCVTGSVAAAPEVYDCNENGVLDECDIDAGTSLDANSNGTPDECEPPPCRCIYDLDNSCFIDAADLGLFAECWLCEEGQACWTDHECAMKDWDVSGAIDAADLGLFAGAWLKDCDELMPAEFQGGWQCDGEILCPWPQ
jgi:hypothetical protein